MSFKNNNSLVIFPQTVFSTFIGCGSDDALSCSGSLCSSASCEAHDNSVCEIDSCSNCTIKHYAGLQEVTDQCGMFYT